MDDRSFYFLEIMIALGVVGIIAFLIFLIGRHTKPQDRRADVTPENAAGYLPHWPEFLLAALALVIIVGLIAWQFFAEGQGDVATGDWRDANRSVIFTVVMLAGAGLGLVVFIVFVFARGIQDRAAPSPFNFSVAEETQNSDDVVSPGTTAPTGNVETPGPIRLLGLLGLALAVLLLNWVYLTAEQQFKLMSTLIYPAAFVIAMVMLFDKVTRAWSPKPAAEVFREWLLCIGLIVLLMLGYLNLGDLLEPKKYNAMFWDMVHVFAFLLILWLLDRKLTRYRFLVVFGYLVLLPILYLLWRFFQDLPLVEGIPFWSSLWPFFILAGIFFVLEIIALISTRNSNHQLLPTLKDVLFFVIYLILLIVAIPAPPE